MIKKVAHVVLTAAKTFASHYRTPIRYIFKRVGMKYSMGSDVTFTINDIRGAVLVVPLSPHKDNPLESVVQALRTRKFATTKTYVADFTNVMDDVFSKLTFMGTGFAFGLLKTKFIAQFLHATEFINPNTDMRSENKESAEVLSDENLKMVSSDFNYILGLMLGKMSVDNNNIEFTFNIQMSKETSSTQNLNHLLASESKVVFGNVTDLKMNGISIKMVENILGTQVKSEYNIGESQDKQDKNYHNVTAEFKFKSSGPVDFSKLVKESTNRINDLVRNIGSGAHE